MEHGPQDGIKGQDVRKGDRGPIQGLSEKCASKREASPTFWGAPHPFRPLSLSSTPFDAIFSRKHTHTHTQEEIWDQDLAISFSNLGVNWSVVNCYSELSSSSTRWYAYVLSFGSLWCFHPWLHLLAYLVFIIILLITPNLIKKKCSNCREESGNKRQVILHP